MIRYLMVNNYICFFIPEIYTKMKIGEIHFDILPS